MAGDALAAADLAQLWIDGGAVLRVAELLEQPAPCMKSTAGRRRSRGGNVAPEHEALLANARIRIGHSRKERDRIGVERMGIKSRHIGHFDELAQVHDSHPIADVLDDREVVSD